MSAFGNAAIEVIHKGGLFLKNFSFLHLYIGISLENWKCTENDNKINQKAYQCTCKKRSFWGLTIGRYESGVKFAKIPDVFQKVPSTYLPKNLVSDNYSR